MQHSVWDYLVGEVKTAEKDVGAAVNLLSEIVEYAHIPGRTIDLISRSLVRILLFVSLKPEHMQALSRKALLYFLKATKVSCEAYTHARLLTTTEFMRFRTIVLWCACQQFCSEKTSPSSSSTVPLEVACVMKLLEKSSNQRNRITSEEERELYHKIEGKLAASVKEFLPWVDFQHFSPDDIRHVVAPMKIVPNSILRSVSQSHTDRAPFKSEEDTLGWATTSGCGTSTAADDEAGDEGRCLEAYEMDDDGNGVQKCTRDDGFLYYKLCIDREAGGVYEWEITIEKVPEKFVEVGLFYTADQYDTSLYMQSQDYAVDPYWDPDNLLDPYPRRLSEISDGNVGVGPCCLRMDHKGISFHPSRKASANGDSRHDKCWEKLGYGKDYAHEKSKVRICLDLLKDTCSISVDGDDLGVIWAKFPAGVYYPAVSLGTGFAGRVSIKVLKTHERDFTSKST